MSTCYIVSEGPNGESTPIPVDTFKSWVDESGLYVAEERKENFCISDGSNYLWVYVVEDHVTGFERFGGNNPRNMLGMIENRFNVTVLSEHDIGGLPDDEN